MAASDDLQSAINNVAALLKDLTANPKPTYSVGGQSISWGDYFSMLNQQYEQLKKNLAMEEGVFEVRHVGIS